MFDKGKFEKKRASSKYVLPRLENCHCAFPLVQCLPTRIGGATTECRATFKHSPNEPARLARQWMKERGIIVYLVARLARLARQWKNFYGVKC